MRGNDSTLPTAHYTVGPEGDRIKNKGENGPDRVRTAQNTHSGQLNRRKGMKRCCSASNDPRDRTILRLCRRIVVSERLGFTPAR